MTTPTLRRNGISLERSKIANCLCMMLFLGLPLMLRAQSLSDYSSRDDNAASEQGHSAPLPVGNLVGHVVPAKPVVERIVNGNAVVDPDKYPFFGRAILFLKEDRNYCGAVLIHPDIALSAAHCRKEKPGQDDPWKDKIRFDTLDLQSGGVEREVDFSVAHPWYNPFDFDFRIVKLKTPAPSDIKLATLGRDTNHPRVGDTVVAIGFGQTNPKVGSTWPNTLQEINMTVAPNTDCEFAFNQVQNLPHAQICHRRLDPQGQIDGNICNSDSGGPVFDTNGVVVGVVSFGYGKDCLAWPSGSARVAAAFGWIQEQICTLSSQPPQTPLCDCLSSQPPQSPLCKCLAATSVTSLPFSYSGPTTSAWFKYQGKANCVRVNSQGSYQGVVHQVGFGSCHDMSCVRSYERESTTNLENSFFAQNGMDYFVYWWPQNHILYGHAVTMEEIPLSPNPDKLVACEGPIAEDYYRRDVKVAISGNTAVVGVVRPFGARRGLVYVFEHDGSNWHQVATLTSSGCKGYSSDHILGWSSVAIDGDVIVVTGLEFDDPLERNSILVFEKSNGVWPATETARLKPSDYTSTGNLVVDIDGATIVVGARLAEAGLGAVYIFERTGSNWPHLENQKLLSSVSRAGGGFGFSVAVSGRTMVIGQPTTQDQGSIHIFEKTGKTWGLAQPGPIFVDCADTGTFISDGLGRAVAIDGNFIVAGAETFNRAYVFEKKGLGWSLVEELRPHDLASPSGFGVDAAISGDAIIITWKDSGYYPYIRDTAGTGKFWRPQQRIHPSDGVSEENVGSSVAISGNKFVVGGPGNPGAPYSFEVSSLSNLSPQPPPIVPQCQLGTSGATRPPRPPRPFTGRLIGDPHLETLDGLRYDCQASGEFVLLRSLDSQFQIQVRFSGVANSIGARASVTTAIAVQETGSPSVQVSMSNGTQGQTSECLSFVDLYVDGTPQDIAEGLDSPEVVVETSSNNIVISLFSGLEVHLATVQSDSFGCFFSHWLYLPETYRSSERLVGLLGTPNGSPSDDWTTSSGATLGDPPAYPESFFEAGYNYCTTNWCLRSPEDSLFSYELGQTFADFFGCDATYQAGIEAAISSASSELTSICASNIECIIDGVVGDISDAQAYVREKALIENAIAERLGNDVSSSVIPSTSPSDLPPISLVSPSSAPSNRPTSTMIPSVAPSGLPSTLLTSPLAAPSVAQSALPSHIPTIPLEAPSVAPSNLPTSHPTSPFVVPSIMPSFRGTEFPSTPPSAGPTVSKSMSTFTNAPTANIVMMVKPMMMRKPGMAKKMAMRMWMNVFVPMGAAPSSKSPAASKSGKMFKSSKCMTKKCKKMSQMSNSMKSCMGKKKCKKKGGMMM